MPSWFPAAAKIERHGGELVLSVELVDCCVRVRVTRMPDPKGARIGRWLRLTEDGTFEDAGRMRWWIRRRTTAGTRAA
jgi:hypothetical protein